MYKGVASDKSDKSVIYSIQEKSVVFCEICGSLLRTMWWANTDLTDAAWDNILPQITRINTDFFVQRRVPRGHVSIRNPLQAPKERSCGINNPPHPLLVPRSGTDHHPQHHLGCVSPPSGNYMGWKYCTYPQLRCFAACSGFHDIGPAPRNLQLILNLLVVRGCVAMPCKYRTKSKKLLQNKNWF